MIVFVRRYGAHPLHLLALLASFALVAYAALRLLPAHPLAVAIWFVGAAVAHDLLLLPAYAVIDASMTRLSRARRRRLPTTPAVNYLRVPLVLSGLLLLVYFPSILGLSGIYAPITGQSTQAYLGRWLAITAALFLLSELVYAARLARKAWREHDHHDRIRPIRLLRDALRPGRDDGTRRTKHHTDTDTDEPRPEPDPSGSTVRLTRHQSPTPDGDRPAWPPP